MKNEANPVKRRRKSALNENHQTCPIERGMRLIGGKWTSSVIYHLKDGPVRFNELCRQLGGASRKMIDQRLKELEQNNLVKRTVLAQRPIAVSYELTKFGHSALEVLEPLREWTEKHDI
ncbi:winged helix-turn-helix transcriptional regulator [Salinimonas profundi]|uniref:winged helix-turn-helix transcriptional regulator n=1 Tax=Salinimonas profundi TaxID=2729140 RepID=UPI00295E745C|nr:helix-turn-helix domain-containing protein [Salinimonas profundi]